MSDFKILQVPGGGIVISAPKRAKRPDQAVGQEPPCPFEGEISEVVYSLREVKVKRNKYPFAAIHEVVIHSSNHSKNFDELPISKVEDVVRVYRQRFSEHKDKGRVYIFNNSGEKAGESLPHPHSQLVVIPNDVEFRIIPLKLGSEEIKETGQFYVFCPQFSQLPDEVWIAPKREGRYFDEITNDEVKDLALTLQRLIQIFDMRHGHDFPFNFYIYPDRGWYLRLIPRLKIVGGFEISTDIFVNTQDPAETFRFIREHFDKPDFEKIKSQQFADYKRSV